MILNHCHAGPADYFRRLSQGQSGEDGALALLEPYLRELGYSRAVCFAPFAQWFHGDPNAWLLKAVAGDPRFVPWVTINPPVAGAAAALQDGLGGGAKGVKFHPPITGIAINDPGLEDFFALAEERRLPILFHTGPHGWILDKYRPALVGGVARRHPKLPLIIEHLGGASLAAETWEVMRAHPNVRGGLASCLLPEATWHVPAAELKARVAELGAQRFIFGADFPYNSADYNRRSMGVLEGLGLERRDLEGILSGNLEALL